MLPRELSAIIEAAHRLNPRLAAFTSLLSPQGEQVVASSTSTGAELTIYVATDAALAFRQAPAGPLHGAAVAVKDAFCTTDLPTTAASRMLRGKLRGVRTILQGLTCSTTDYTSPFDATVVKRLRAAGALIHGKNNMDEFGMGSVGRMDDLSSPMLTYHAPLQLYQPQLVLRRSAQPRRARWSQRLERRSSSSRR